MGKYEVVLNGTSYELPLFTTRVSKQLEEVQKILDNSDNVERSLHVMYDFAEKMLGKENVLEALGKFEDADPNVINITYVKIYDTFNKPFLDFMKEKNSDKIAPELRDILNKLATVAENIPDKK